jgi:hypothetical protein
MGVLAVGYYPLILNKNKMKTSQDTPHNTKFYTVDLKLIAPNHPAWNPNTHTIDQ